MADEATGGAVMTQPTLLPKPLALLTATPHWVCWRYVQKKKRKKPTKVPFQPNGKFASSDDPATWSSYEAVVEAAPKFDGIGFALTDTDLAAFDLDKCRDAQTG